MTKAASLLGSKWVLQTVEGNVIKMPEGIEKPSVKLVKEGSKVEGLGAATTCSADLNWMVMRMNFPNLASTKKYCEAIPTNRECIRDGCTAQHQGPFQVGRINTETVPRDP